MNANRSGSTGIHCSLEVLKTFQVDLEQALNPASFEYPADNKSWWMKSDQTSPVWRFQFGILIILSAEPCNLGPSLRRASRKKLRDIDKLKEKVMGFLRVADWEGLFFEVLFSVFCNSHLQKDGHMGFRQPHLIGFTMTWGFSWFLTREPHAKNGSFRVEHG